MLKEPRSISLLIRIPHAATNLLTQFFKLFGVYLCSLLALSSSVHAAPRIALKDSAAVVTASGLPEEYEVFEWKVSKIPLKKNFSLDVCIPKEEISQLAIFTKRQRKVRFRTKNAKDGRTVIIPVTKRLRRKDFPLVMSLTTKRPRLKDESTTRLIYIKKGKRRKLATSGPSCTSLRSVKSSMGTEGGMTELPKIVRVEASEGTFSEQTALAVNLITSQDIEALQEEFGFLFGMEQATPYQIDISTGAIQPDKTVKGYFTLPPEIVREGAQYEVFARVLHGGDEELLETIELIPSTLEPTTGEIVVRLSPVFFDNSWNEDGSFSAQLFLAVTPGASRQLEREGFQAAEDPAQCMANAIACPVNHGCLPTSHYSPGRKHPVTGALRPHYGVDFASPVGSQINAAADAVVERSYTSKSYGETIVLRHGDGGATLYAHLSARDVKPGDKVSKGGRIGLSGNTGLSSGPHLHFEYVPNGEIIQSKNRIDPFPCIGSTLSGSITVADNGALADDAFEVFLDGFRLGATEIGASNSLAVSNLVPGEHSLTLTGLVIPDNIGTYLINLSDGLLFADGTSSASGILSTEGASRTFTIMVGDK